MPSTRILTNREIYESAVLKLVPSAGQRLWIATADLKDMHHFSGSSATSSKVKHNMCGEDKFFNENGGIQSKTI